jgi:hypothetical protein
MSKLFLIIVSAMLLLAATVVAILWFRTPPFDCQSVAAHLQASGAHLSVESWLDEHGDKWDKHDSVSPPKHVFGYGSFVLPLTIDWKKFDLNPDAEAQAVVDKEGEVEVIQLVDSSANIVVVNRRPNTWYQWRPSSLALVNDRTGVVCQGRD